MHHKTKKKKIFFSTLLIFRFVIYCKMIFLKLVFVFLEVISLTLRNNKIYAFGSTRPNTFIHTLFGLIKARLVLLSWYFCIFYKVGKLKCRTPIAVAHSFPRYGLRKTAVIDVDHLFEHKKKELDMFLVWYPLSTFPCHWK